MDKRAQTGTRLRNRRLDLGLPQADVARRIGVSASYLNLIEHNRRRIGATLLGDLAKVLAVDVALLREGTAAAVLAPLQEAAAAHGADATTAEDLVARFPDWAAVITAQAARIKTLEARTRALGNRLAHDTQIATSLHDVISTATAIRSTASILTESPDLDRDWQQRFHRNIDADSARLAQSSTALLGFLDVEAEAGDVQPLEAAEAVMAQRGFYLAEAEAGQMPDFDGAGDAATRAILTAWAQAALRDAAALPLDAFLPAARAVAFDPARLAARFAAPLDRILRRLAHLPPHADAPAMGLAVCDAAGVVTFQKPVLDFRLPRAGAACPLWPLYQALTQPGRGVSRVVRLPGPARTPFECFAIATPQGDAAFDAAPRVAATMLVRVARGGDAPHPVGPGCRLCSQPACAARRHPGLV